MLMYLLLVPVVVLGQHSQTEDVKTLQLKKVAKEIMTAAPNCALITLDSAGRPSVRMMDAFLPEDDFTVWFGTNPKSRKVAQIKNNSKVTLYYTERDSSGYVMIQGNAVLVNSKKEKEKRWKPEWEAFYKDKKKGYILIRVVPKRMEVVSYAHDVLGDPETWQPAIVKFKN